MICRMETEKFIIQDQSTMDRTGNNIRLTNDLAVSETPSICADGSNVHLVWIDYRNGNQEVYYKRSTNSGLSWSSDIRLTNNPAYTYSPSISVSGLYIHVTWSNYRDGNFEIYYKRSVDGGISWGADTRLTNNSAPSRSPTISS